MRSQVLSGERRMLEALQISTVRKVSQMETVSGSNLEIRFVRS